jgi:thioredoxin-like negative regulator of GroEL
MKKRPERNDPESSKAPVRSAWLGLAFREPTGRGTIRIRIRWGRVLLLMGILGAGLWLGKSIGLYYFFREVREFRDVAFIDMVLYPANRGSVRVEQGRYQIEEGQAALDREDYRRAFALLREGVARAPSHVEGRMLLAQIYAGWRPDLATELMVDGVDFGYENPDFIRLLSSLLLAEKKDLQMLSISEELLERDLPEPVRHTILVSRVQAALFRGQYATVRDIFESTDLETTLDGLLLGTRLYQRTGRTDDAIGVLLSVINRFPDAELDPVYEQLVGLYKEQEAYEEARTAALELVIRNPMEWRPRILLIDVLSASKRTERRDREIDSLLRQHRGDEVAMTALAQLSAGYGNVQASARLYEIALENGYDLGVFTLALAEAYINNGRSERAVSLCNELVREDPGWLVNAESSFNAIRSLAYYESGDRDLGRLYLQHFLDSRRTRVGQFFQAARSFREAGWEQAALRILEEAYARDANNEAILGELIDMEMQLGRFFAIGDHLDQLFELRRPDYDLLRSIHERLLSDRFLFTGNRVELLEKLQAILAEGEAATWEIWRKETASAS